MNKLVKIVSLLMILGTVLLASAEAGVLTFSLPETQQRAQEADVDAIFAQRDIDNLIEAKEDAVEDADEINVLAGTPETQLQSKVDKYIGPLRAEMDLKIAIQEEDQRLQQREDDITNAYWQIHLAELAIEKAQNDLTIADNQYQAAQIKLTKGSISGAMLSSEKYNYEAKRLNLIEARHNYQKALFDLNELLGEELTTVVKSNGDIELEVPDDWQFNIVDVYEQALTADENIYRLTREVEFAGMKLQYAGEEYQNYQDEYLDVLDEKERAEYDLETAKNNLYIDITTAGNSILTSIEDYNLLKLKLAIDQQSLKSMEVKLDQGLISKNEFLIAKLGAQTSEYALKSAAVALNYNYHSFNNKYIYVSK